jgi:hypothetical protein
MSFYAPQLFSPMISYEETGMELGELSLKKDSSKLRDYGGGYKRVNARGLRK